jgi:hypothetical protein
MVTGLVEQRHRGCEIRRDHAAHDGLREMDLDVGMDAVGRIPDPRRACRVATVVPGYSGHAAADRHHEVAVRPSGHEAPIRAAGGAAKRIDPGGGVRHGIGRASPRFASCAFATVASCAVESGPGLASAASSPETVRSSAVAAASRLSTRASASASVELIVEGDEVEQAQTPMASTSATTCDRFMVPRDCCGAFIAARRITPRAESADAIPDRLTHRGRALNEWAAPGPTTARSTSGT